MKKKALFLDRDGVINIDKGYVYRIDDFKFIPQTIEFIKKMQKEGFLPIVITNQSGIGRGYYTLEDFKTLTKYMLEAMNKEGIIIDDSQIFFCPHSPDSNCDCRKPKPKMILEAIERFNIDPLKSLLIGDKRSDIEASYRANLAKAIYIDSYDSITKAFDFNSFEELKSPKEILEVITDREVSNRC